MTRSVVLLTGLLTVLIATGCGIPEEQYNAKVKEALKLKANLDAATAANKKLSEALAKLPASTPLAPGPPGTPRVSTKPFPGNYCWTHGHRVSERHTSATCTHKAAGHKDAATASNMMGGSHLDKGWNTRRT